MPPIRRPRTLISYRAHEPGAARQSWAHLRQGRGGCSPPVLLVARHDLALLKPRWCHLVRRALMPAAREFPAHFSCEILPRRPGRVAPARPMPARGKGLLGVLAPAQCVPVPASGTPAREGSSGRKPQTNHMSLPSGWQPPGSPALVPLAPAPLPRELRGWGQSRAGQPPE